MPNYESDYEIERMHIIKRLIQDFGSGTGKNALDIGCGRGLFSEFLLSCGYTTIGVDINKDELNLAYKRCSQYSGIKFSEIDLEKYGLKKIGTHFDLVLCLEIIEHLKKPIKLIQCIMEVMSKGGRLIISTPNILSLEGFRGKLLEYCTGTKFIAWDPTHRKIFSSFGFAHLLMKNQNLRILKIIGYWYSSNRLPKLKVRLALPIKYTSMPFINMFGFNIIIVAEKI